MKQFAPLSFAALFGVLAALPALAAPATAPSGIVGMTNAERLALGLSPMAPTKRSTAPKVRRSSATVTNATTNSTPVLLIRIANPDGSDLGYLSMPDDGTDPNADNGDMVGFDPDFNRALRFGYPGQRSGAGSGLGDDGSDGLDGQDGPFELYPYDDGTFGKGNTLLGVIAESDLLPGTPSFAGLGMAQPGPNGPLGLQLPLDLLHDQLGDGSSLPGGDALSSALDPVTGADGGADDLASLDQVGQLLGTGQPCSEAQSKVWSFVPGSKQLLAAYSNSNGQIVPTKFVTGGGCNHFICLTADVALFKHAYGMDATEVFLHATVM